MLSLSVPPHLKLLVPSNQVGASLVLHEFLSGLDADEVLSEVRALAELLEVLKGPVEDGIDGLLRSLAKGQKKILTTLIDGRKERTVQHLQESPDAGGTNVVLGCGWEEGGRRERRGSLNFLSGEGRKRLEREPEDETKQIRVVWKQFSQHLTSSSRTSPFISASMVPKTSFTICNKAFGDNSSKSTRRRFLENGASFNLPTMNCIDSITVRKR